MQEQNSDNKITLEECKKKLEAFLKLPFRWDLPKKTLQVGDPDYDYFMCRTGNIVAASWILEYLAKHDIIWPDKKPKVLELSQNIRSVINTNNRTEEEMGRIRGLLEESIKFLEL